KDSLSNCCQKLCKDAELLSKVGRIYGRSATVAADAVSVLATPQSSRTERMYVQFAQDIIRHSNPGILVLCAASLGKYRIARLSVADRARLVVWIKENQALLHSKTLDTLAEQYRIPL
ncbi:uncharacterized protein EI97DRAFT_348727, partial [Westerdykella ornata]